MRRFSQNQAVTEHFNSTAQNYLPGYTDQSWLGYAFRIRKQRVLEMFDKPGGRVLDVGCGPGVMAPDMVELGCEFWGMDTSSEMVRQAESRYADIGDTHFSVGTAERLEFEDNYFDAALCMGVIDFVDDDRAALSEMARVLQPDGTLIVAFMNRHSPFILWRDNVFNPATSRIRPIFHKMSSRPRKPHIKQRTHTEKSVHATLNDLGCEIVDTVYYFFNFALPPLEHMFPRLTARASMPLERFGRGSIRRLAAGFAVKARKV